MNKKLLMGACATILAWPMTAHADPSLSYGSNGLRADSHAPIGVMGDHLHARGEWMVSYRYMRMHMEDNRDGTSRLSPKEIVTQTPNPFFGNPMQPATLRVVPTQMTTDMHMIGAMYAPTDRVTLMAMGHYIDREMDHITFAGGAGTTRLGNFTTEAKGFGDTKLSTLVGLYKDDTHHMHLNAGLSLPTGSITERDDVLTPMGGRPNMRLPYAMQLGSGTFDAMPGITYYGNHDNFGWGAQYSATFRLGENSEDYSLGDKHQITTWGSYSITPTISLSARITAEHEGEINGQDSNIMAPVQTANPNNFGGRRISTSLGMNTVVPSGILEGHRFTIEATVPVYQDLNGPQLERDNTIIFGWQKAF